MASMTCRTCSKPFHVDLVKCPYCNVSQPSASLDTRDRTMLRAALVATGLLLGGLIGFLSGYRFAAGPRPTMAPPNFRAAIDEKTATVRKALHDALAELAADPSLKVVSVEDAYLDPASHLGEKMAVVGMPFNANGETASLGTYFGSPISLRVNISELPKARKLDLLRIQFPPHIIILKGSLVRSGNAFPNNRSFAFEFWPTDFTDIGEKPGGGVNVSDFLPRK